jgi:copper chaperone
MTVFERTYTVEGMTCGHCRDAVMQEVLQVPGVRAADVDLGLKQLVVAGEEIDDDAIRAAVDGAGYELAS